MKKQDSFTLVELLVVAAIIVLIVSLAVVATFHYKDKANDSRIKEDLSQVRTIASRIDNEDNSYTGLCKNGHLNANPDGHPNYGDELKIIKDDIVRITGGEIACHANGADFCIQSTALTADFLCIDSTGYLGEEANCAEGNKKCVP